MIYLCVKWHHDTQHIMLWPYELHIGGQAILVVGSTSRAKRFRLFPQYSQQAGEITTIPIGQVTPVRPRGPSLPSGIYA